MTKFSRNGIWFDAEPVPVDVIDKYAKTQPRIVLEFGSYDGGSAILYKEQWPDARVISVEACPVRFSIIDKYSKLMNLECYEYAVCDIDGEAEFYQMKDPNMHSVDNPKSYGASGSVCKHTDRYKNKWPHLEIIDTPIIVQSIRVDTLCKKLNIEHIDVIHIDAEGAEKLVIQGFGNMRPTFVWAETHLDKSFYGDKAYDSKEIDKILVSMGYTFIYTNGCDRLYVI